MDKKVIFVQESGTGRCLPLLVDEGLPEDAFIVDAVLSKDGKYLGLLYKECTRSIYILKYTITYATVWEINAELNFTEIARSGTWADKLITGKACLNPDSGFYFKYMPQPIQQGQYITFGEDGQFYYLFGRTDPVTCATESFALPEIVAEPVSDCRYSRDAQYFIMQVRDDEIIKLSTQFTASPEHLPWPKGLRKIVNVSSNGRYAIVRSQGWIEPYEYGLIDTLHMKAMTIPVSSGSTLSTGWLQKHYCVVSADETRLLDFRHFSGGGCSSIAVVIWSLPKSPVDILDRELSHEEIAAPHLTNGLRHLHILPDETSGWFVSDDGVVEKLMWDRPEQESIKAMPPESIFFEKLDFVSKDGAQLGTVSYGPCSAQVQILDITSMSRSLHLLRLALLPLTHGKSNYRKKEI